MAEIPALPGCRAWAETDKETLAELSAVAEHLSFPAKTGARKFLDSGFRRNDGLCPVRGSCLPGPGGGGRKSIIHE